MGRVHQVEIVGNDSLHRLGLNSDQIDNALAAYGSYITTSAARVASHFPPQKRTSGFNYLTQAMDLFGRKDVKEMMRQGFNIYDLLINFDKSDLGSIWLLTPKDKPITLEELAAEDLDLSKSGLQVAYSGARVIVLDYIH